MWKPFDPKKPSLGFKEGELKIWNLNKSTVDIYKSYTRGDDDDDVKIIIKKDGEVVEDATSKIEDYLGDVNEFVMESVERGSVDSVMIAKQQKLEGAEAELMSKIGSKGTVSSGLVEFIDAKEFEPLYWYDLVRGAIRFYEIDPRDLSDMGEGFELADKDGKPVKKKGLYWEILYYEDDGKLMMSKYFETELLAEGEAPYESMPYTIQTMSPGVGERFDIDSLSNCVVLDLVKIQDYLNSYLTTVSLALTKGALPLFTVNHEWYNKATDKDFTKLRKYFEGLSTAQASIMVAPIKREGGVELPSFAEKHMTDIFEQFYMVTGIPRSTFNSEGLGNTSGVALTQLFESLSRRVGAIRTSVTNFLTGIALSMLQNENIDTTDITVEVQYPSMLTLDFEAKLRLLELGNNTQLVASETLQDQFIALLGEEEDAEQIKAKKAEEDVALKAQIERSIQRAQEIQQAEIEEDKKKEEEDLISRVDNLN